MIRLLLTTLFVLLPLNAQAFIVLKNWNGQTEQWGSNNVTWTMATSVMNDVPFADLQTALTNAFKAWQDVGCATIAFTNGGQRATDPQTGIHFTFRQNGWDPAVADALAYSVAETSQNGTITSSDIVFNAFDAEWTVSAPTPFGKNDIQGVATHEIGHSLGLDHARALAATMFFTGGSVDLRTLDADDARGLCFLYPGATFTTGQLCDSCDTTSNCQGGTCLSWGAGHAYCGRNCGAGNACPDGFGCYEIEGVATPQCIPDSEFCHDYGGNVALGDPCFGNAQCASGQCLALGDEAYCSRSCNAASPGSCGAGFTCVAPGICLKAGQTPYGQACEDHGDCATAQCIYFQFAVGVCSEGCAQASDCPNGDRCYDGAACVPPGPLGNGAACSTPDQCRGMYCEDGACTQQCGTCPRGTTCTGGFCVGSEIGGACAANGSCPDGLTCQTVGADDVGTCQRQCSAFTGTGCLEDEVCEWFWQPHTEKILGRCVALDGGAGLGESCATRSCAADLVCQADEALCRRDCRNSDGYGCDSREACVSLADAADPQHGLCIPEVIVAPDPGPEPTPEPVPDTDDVTTVEDTSATTTVADTAVTTIPPQTGNGAGCAGAGLDGLAWLGLAWLGLLALGLRRRRAHG